MISDDEARTAYDELLKKLRDIGAADLVLEISRTVGAGRVQERKREHMQERLPAKSALAIALRMLAAWCEPVFLVPEAAALLREASGERVDKLRWYHDRLDVVEPEAQTVTPADTDELIVAIPPLSAESDDLRRQVENLHAIARELAESEGE